MSYIRWSSDIKNVMPFEEEMQLYSEGKDYEHIKRIKEERGAVLSDWYIYYHANDSTEPQTRENQLLSIWHKSMTGLGTFAYKEVRDMYDRDDWSNLTASEITQKEIMRECVLQWLTEVEEEYGVHS